jgi:DNA/RNA endonuclease G (NUC1)
MVNVQTKSSKLRCIALKNEIYLKEMQRKVKKLEKDEHVLFLPNVPSMHYDEFPKVLEYNKQMFLKIK